MSRRRIENPCWEAESYLKKAQEVISRSLHELATVGLRGEQEKERGSAFEPYRASVAGGGVGVGSSCAPSLRRRKSAAELYSSSVHRPNTCRAHLERTRSDAARSLFAINVFEENPIPRRKRFTRRQKRNASRERASRSTSALNGTLSSSSSSAEDESPTFRNPPHRHNIKSLNGSQQIEGVNSRVSESLLSTKVQPNNLQTSNSTTSATSQKVLKSRGPTARKAQRRAAALKCNVEGNRLRSIQARSHARLDSVNDSEELKPKIPVRRSLSVKDLNGTMVDFFNHDSVTRWTSQILAELDSLPSSRLDLHEIDKSCAKESELDTNCNNAEHSPFSPVAVAERFSSDANRNPVLNHESGQDVVLRRSCPRGDRYITGNVLAPSEVMISSSSTIASELMSTSAFSSASNVSATVWNNSDNDRLSLSMGSLAHSGSGTLLRCGDEDSEDGEGTPRATTPTPTEEVWNTEPVHNGSRPTSLLPMPVSRPIRLCECPRPFTQNGESLSKSKSECFCSYSFTAKPSQRRAQEVSAVVVPSECARPSAPPNVATKPLSPMSRLRRFLPKRRSKSDKQAEHPNVSPAHARPRSVLGMEVSPKKRTEAEQSKIATSAERELRSPMAVSPKKSSSTSTSTDQKLFAVARQKPSIDDVESQMFASIARLSKSVCGNLSPEKRGNAADGDVTVTPLSKLPVAISRWENSNKSDVGVTQWRSLGCGEFPAPRGVTLRNCSEKSTSPLNVWKRKAQQRALQAARESFTQNSRYPSRDCVLVPQHPDAKRSVHGIVASLIRAAEETRFEAPDKPPSLRTSNFDSTASRFQQEAGTQTSPFSLSRSSSFDWINEPCDPVDLDVSSSQSQTRTQHSSSCSGQPPSNLSASFISCNTRTSFNSCPWSLNEDREDEDKRGASLNAKGKGNPAGGLPSREEELERIADAQVQEMLRRSENIRRQVIEERQIRANQDIDDSIAMLLEYAGDLRMSPDVNSDDAHRYPSERPFEQIRKVTSGCEVSLCSPQCATSSPGFSPSEPFAHNHNANQFGFDSFSNECLRGRSHVASSSSTGTASVGASGLSVMNDSIYDNVHDLRRNATASERAFRDELPPSPSVKRNGGFADSSPTEVYSPASEERKKQNGPQRELSISSGLLADSESSPMSPPATFPPERRVERKPSDRKSSSNPRRRSRVAPIEINSSFCTERTNFEGSGMNDPPPPSPRSTSLRPRAPPAASELFMFGTRISDRAGSCEQLHTDLSQQGGDELFVQKKQKAEEEALECCQWLRDAGFPQYARFYEEHRFPIDIRSVQRDHEFLDADSLKALFRRLNALNRCAIMKVENVVLRKHSDRFDVKANDSDVDDDIIGGHFEDDEDEVAISNRWRYQRKSQTWSRIVAEDLYANHCGIPISNKEGVHMSVGDGEAWARHDAQREREWRSGRGFSHDETATVASATATTHDDLIHETIADCEPPRNHVDASETARPGESKGSRGLQRSQSERIKERARALMKRMDIRSSSRRRKQRGGGEMPSNGHDLVIGQPVLVSHYSASPRSMNLYQNGALPSRSVRHSQLDTARYPSEDRLPDPASFAVLQPTTQLGSLAPQSSNFYANSRAASSGLRPTNFAVRNPKSSRRRMGIVVLSPTSPTSDSSQTDELMPGSRYEGESRRCRDVSLDPGIMRCFQHGDPRDLRDSRDVPLKSRIYDRVAVDEFPAMRMIRRTTDGLSDFGHAEHFSSSNQRSFNQLGGYTSNPTNVITTLQRGGVATSVDSLPPQMTRNFRSTSERRVNAIASDSLPSTVYNLSEKRRLVVNADGYYEHISDFASSSPEATVDRQGVVKLGHQSLFGLQRAISPTSSSSTASTSNVASRLKVDIDRANKQRHIASSASPSIAANFAQRSHSSLESSGNDEEMGQSASANGDRRDSGVGSSLSRSPSGPTTQRQRNSILTNGLLNNNHLPARDSRRRTVISTTATPSVNIDDSETFICDADLPRCVDALSVGEMLRLRKLAFLKLSVLVERYAGSGVRIGGGGGSSGGANVKNWAVQKLMRRIRSPDFKPPKGEVSIFGLPLTIVQSRTGVALPRCILEAMRFLRTMASETVGIFRKNGVRSRIAELRSICDVDPEQDAFVDGKGLDPMQVHDIADLLKQYFRELPEPLMTAKYSDAFANIHLYLPTELRMEALQYAVLLLPDENREALQTLLYFLHDIARHSATNNMTAQNLAVCFAPSLFHLSASRLNTISPTRRHKTIGAAGMPTEREMKESRAAQECLVQMIEHCEKLFVVPSGQWLERDSDSNGYEADAPYLTELGASDEGNYKTYLLQKARELLKEHRDRWKGWIVEGTVDGVEISSKKPADGHPLRYFRAWVDVEAPPKELLMRIIRERNVWDKQAINWRTVAPLSAENCDVFQYVINDTPSHPTRDAMVVRMWWTEMKELRGGCVLIERSVHSSETQLLGGVPAAVLASRFLIEPNAGRSRITYISRIDLRGRSNIWYGKVYGHLVARQMSTLRDSFTQLSQDDEGPETKV